MATKQEHHKFNINDYTPKRFGLNYNPPQIVLEYLTPSTGKLYHHKMRIHKLNPDKKTADMRISAVLLKSLQIRRLTGRSYKGRTSKQQSCDLPRDT